MPPCACFLSGFMPDGAHKSSPNALRHSSSPEGQEIGNFEGVIDSHEASAVYALLLVSASVFAAGQATAPPAAKSLPLRQRPSRQGCGRRFSGCGNPDQRVPARFRRSAEEVRSEARQQIKKLSDEIDNLTKQLQAQAAQLTDAERSAVPAPSTKRKGSWTAIPRKPRATSRTICSNSSTPWPARWARS